MVRKIFKFFFVTNRQKTLKIVLFFFLILGILFWQYSFYSQPKQLDSSFTRTDASGLNRNASKQFLYFYYYLNLYPVVSYTAPTEFSKKGAEDFLKNHSQSIYMDYDFAVMWGDNLKNLMYFPDAILRGTAADPSVKTFNILLFIVALLLVLASFFYIKKPVLGIILILLLGSNPFQLYEVYANENLFGTHISVLMILLSVNLPLFLSMKRPKYYFEFTVIASGIILGTVAHIRIETLALILSCLMLYLFIPDIKTPKKLIYILLLAAVFFVTNLAWVRYFDYKYNQATKVVQSVGGHLSQYADLRQSHHTVWHSIFAGFGDFDQKYGYKWSDQTVYSYALPILRDRGVAIPKDLEAMGVMPEYQEIIKEKVISQIKSDPKWYKDIINGRTDNLFKKTTPITLKINNHAVGFTFSKPWLISLIVLLIILLLISKNFFLLKLLLFSFPPSLVIIGVYSQRNITSISVFQIFTFAIYFYLTGIIVGNLIKTRWRKPITQTIIRPLINNPDFQ